MEDRIREIIESFSDLDDLMVKKLLNVFLRNDPVDVVYKTSQDSLGKIWITECPVCGETLRFDRFSQIAFPYNFCYHCGKKLNKRDENDVEKASE